MFHSGMEVDNKVSDLSHQDDSSKELHGVAEGKIRKKRKRTASEKNFRLRKYVKPKNAVICLNELKPGIVYNVENDGNLLPTTGTTTVSVEVDGHKFIGTGATKQLAKQDAAEAALVSFVKPPPTDGEQVQDNTPWSVLACFAMYKLFNKWMEDREKVNSDCSNVDQKAGMMNRAAFQQATCQAAALNRNLQMPQQIAENDASIEVFSAYLGKPLKEASRVARNPAKKGPPEMASSMHPLMLLHQMKPGLHFVQNKHTSEDTKQVIFTVSSTIDGQTFSGEGTNLKKAKLSMAKKANKVLFDIDSTYGEL